MKISIQVLAASLQTLLVKTADEAARSFRFIIRQRKLTGSGFVQTLVLGWAENPDAKIEEFAEQLSIAPQSLHQRLNSKAIDCLGHVLREAITHLFEARPETIPLLRRFPEVCIEDSTTINLPADLAEAYPGCGGSEPESGAGHAGLKLLVQLEAITGRVRMSKPAAARVSDRVLQASLPEPPRGSLRLVDLGFFDLKRMAQDSDRGLFWISRVPARLSVDGQGPRRDIASWLRERKTDRIDEIVTLGADGQLTCRLVAVRTPKSVAEERLRRLKRKLEKKRRKLSEAQRMLCEWTVMVTNLVDGDRFPVEQLWVLYRVRWQVELLFKRWKGGGLGRSRGRTGGRVLCELLAKLVGALVVHWGTLTRGGPLCVVSATRAMSWVRRWVGRLREAIGLGDSVAVVKILEHLKTNLDRLPKRPKRARRTTRQTLFAPRFSD